MKDSKVNCMNCANWGYNRGLTLYCNTCMSRCKELKKNTPCDTYCKKFIKKP